MIFRSYLHRVSIATLFLTEMAPSFLESPVASAVNGAANSAINSAINGHPLKPEASFAQTVAIPHAFVTVPQEVE